DIVGDLRIRHSAGRSEGESGHHGGCKRFHVPSPWRFWLVLCSCFTRLRWCRLFEVPASRAENSTPGTSNRERHQSYRFASANDFPKFAESGCRDGGELRKVGTGCPQSRKRS